MQLHILHIPTRTTVSFWQLLETMQSLLRKNPGVTSICFASDAALEQWGRYLRPIYPTAEMGVVETSALVLQEKDAPRCIFIPNFQSTKGMRPYILTIKGDGVLGFDRDIRYHWND